MIPASLPQILDEHGQGLLQEVHVCIPALVLSYDANEQTVDVQPAVTKPLQSIDNIRVYEQLPAIQGIPLVQTSGAGFIVSCPVAADDSVILLFSEQSYSEWRQSGKISNPKDQRRHGIGYPFAIPGIRPDAKKLSSAQANKLVIGKDGSDEQLVIGAGQLDLGATNPQSLADGAALQELFTAIMSAASSSTATETGFIAFTTAIASYLSGAPKIKTTLLKGQ